MKTVKQAADVLGVSSNTIRQWTRDFPDFLSPSATPGQGKTRKFANDDIRLFWTVKLLRAERVEPDEIIARLQSGERIEPLPANDEPPQATQDIHEPLPERSLALEVIENLTNERDYLRQELSEERAARIDAETRAASLAGKLEAIEAMRQELRDKEAHQVQQPRPSWWDRLRGKG